MSRYAQFWTTPTDEDLKGIVNDGNRLAIQGMKG